MTRTQLTMSVKINDTWHVEVEHGKENRKFLCSAKHDQRMLLRRIRRQERGHTTTYWERRGPRNQGSWARVNDYFQVQLDKLFPRDPKQLPLSVPMKPARFTKVKRST
jgi:hypothetical protein